MRTSHEEARALELVLALLQARPHRLGQAEPCFLDGLDALVLLRVPVTVLLLQALDEGVEVGRDFLHLLLLRLDELLQCLHVHRHVLLDLLLLLRAAEVQVLTEQSGPKPSANFFS